MYKNNVGARLRPCPKNSGITLIALVITIIVMLILVAVTISMAVNGGLFEYAGKAVGEMQNAIDLEQQLANGKIKVGDKWYASIDDYIKNNPIEIGMEVNPTEIILKKNEDGAEGEEILTGTITASVFGMENEPEITWEKSSDAITLSTTTGKSVTVEAVGTQNSEITVTAKCTYEGQEYTVTTKVTLEIIEKPAITASTMQSNLASYLGKTVNYGVTYNDKSKNNYGQGKWEIFYADEEHIYLITKGHLVEGKLSLFDKDGKEYNGTSDFTTENLQNKYPAVAQGIFNKTYNPNKTPALQYAGVGSDGTSYTNMKATQYLLDSENWTPYVNDLADWAIGGPTQELLVDSYNASNLSDTDVKLEEPSGVGYATPFTSELALLQQGTYLNHYTSINNSPQAYWIACPFYNMHYMVCRVRYEGYIVQGDSGNGTMAFRPVVCLKSNVEIIWNEITSQYDLNLIPEI